MPKFPITEVYEVKLPIASMPRNDVGQIDFETGDRSISFLMRRVDFQRLGRKIAQLLDAKPDPSLRERAKPQSSEK